MHVQLVARRFSTHPLFKRTAAIEPQRFHFKPGSHIDRKFDRSGPVNTSYLAWGKVGMLCGLLEGLCDHPIEGNVAVTISHGSCEVSGAIEVFNPARKGAIYESLLAIERIAHDLSEDSYVTSVTVTYTQHIKEIEGGFEVE